MCPLCPPLDPPLIVESRPDKADETDLTQTKQDPDDQIWFQLWFNFVISLS